MDGHKEVQTINDSELNTDWWENVNIGKKYANHCQKTLDTMIELQQIWVDI